MAKEPVNAYFSDGTVITEDSDSARELYDKSRYGAINKENKLQLSLIEALYLLDKKWIVVLDGRNRTVPRERFVKRARKLEPKFWPRYCVFRDIRDRGYIIKTALKFGADFRIYERGKKPGEAHARWIVYPVKEGEHLTWHEFAAKNRVAHSTKKRLLIGVVDDEGDVSYWEVRWMRP
ncbi:tRNA-intron lyase [Candidatus Woesearchaeota archaeon]|nr:tRNA-intron lyase [Candidatus Woesearchaeota archaeon]